MITVDQKRKIIQVVNVMETGTPEGRYDVISIFADGKNGSRQITYGRSQATEQGNLRNIVERYVRANGKFSAALEPYLAKIAKQPLVNDAEFKRLLKVSAQEDPLMRNAQDVTFEVLYYEPALHFFQNEGFDLSLSLLVIYDSYIHSGCIPAFLRSRFPEATPARGGDEKAWIKAYTTVRQDWLANHPKKVLRPTVYRTQSYLTAMKEDNWMLAKPLKAHGVTVS
ncbi:chitosanase [Chitinophaga agrisoli]|uniref:Chitosanase n=1 Tax=Chitinophaga agrisoli TaxID=2607653 RepID=A0A5B2W5C5_9BACT|nr:chitosanase [Chitinophaga agrisoli]KAA2245429.1 chitosanase [Chitinophaga agrisoli]